MTKEIGPRERALREMRERQFEHTKSIAAKASPESLREKVAAVPARKPKAAKKRRT